MIRNDVGVSYYLQPVESDDQATSLVQYLNRHGQSAFKSQPDEVQVVMQCASKGEAAEKSARTYMIIECWRLFWEHSDAGVFDLPIYLKD